MRKPGIDYLYNTLPKEALIKAVEAESFQRVVVSFYKYLTIENPQLWRDELFVTWAKMQVLGRIYLANEGINGQLSIPAENLEAFQQDLRTRIGPHGQRVSEQSEGQVAFYKLKIKVRRQIVADGLDHDSYDLNNCGTRLDPLSWHQALEVGDSICIDMRNHYESQVGYFQGAWRPDADTFREELPMVHQYLKGKEDQKILLYCTGGIRCEKASAYLKHHGFQNVHQLEGGIISYAQEVKKHGLPSKFIGKNFVFDERMGERITEDVLSHCYQCQDPSDRQINCANDDCHLLFIQCPSCAEKHQGFCSSACRDFVLLPEQQKHDWRLKQDLRIFRSRLRPRCSLG